MSGYREQGFNFLLKAFNQPSFLEDHSGLTTLHQEIDYSEVRFTKLVKIYPSSKGEIKMKYLVDDCLLYHLACIDIHEICIVKGFWLKDKYQVKVFNSKHVHYNINLPTFTPSKKLHLVSCIDWNGSAKHWCHNSTKFFFQFFHNIIVIVIIIILCFFAASLKYFCYHLRLYVLCFWVCETQACEKIVKDCQHQLFSYLTCGS